MKTIYVEPSSGEHRALTPQHSDASPSQQRPERAEVVTWRTISIVLPAYNEEPVIARTVTDCLRAAERFCPNVEVIVVDDGSRDRTGAIVDALAAADPRVVARHHAPNQGYGAALLTGFAAARGELLFFMDSDGQFDVEDLFNLLRVQEEHPEYVVLGYRERRSDSWLRRVNAWGWKQAVRLVLGLKGVRDVDCAFKLFPTRVVRASGVTARGALINAELLTKLRRMRVPMTQVPVRHYPRTHGAATGANPRVILKAFRELLRLRLRLHLWHPQPQGASESQLEPLLDARSIVVARDDSPSGSAGPVIHRPEQGAGVLKTVDVEQPSRTRDASPPTAPHHWPRPSIKVTWHRMQRWIRVPDVQVGLVATILSIAAYVYYSRAGLLFAYSDAVSHLMIARRVLDSRTPGIAQLGTNWLPLNHILMLPLVWITPLFRDGFAGGFPSMVSYVVGGIFMYRLAYETTSSRAASYVGAAVLLLNPNLFYMQATGMSESDLICCTVLLTYFLVRWSKTERLGDLILCALACLGATLIRYDGWALTASAAVYVLMVTWQRNGWIRARAIALFYGLLAFAGCAGWIVYNQILFGSGLEFYNGTSSAKFQGDAMAASGQLPTRHNALLSLHVYVQTVLDNLSPAVFLLAVVGLVFLVLRRRGVPVFVLLAPFVFNWLMLFMGVTVIITPEIPFRGVVIPEYNVRYGLEMLPAAALFTAVVFQTVTMAQWARYARVALSVAWIAMLVILTGQQTLAQSSYTLADGLRGGSGLGRVNTLNEAKYIHDHYHGGKILVSYSPFAPTVFFADLPDQEFITDSEGATFRYALAHPASVEWIIVDEREPDNVDLVWQGLTQGWQAHFTLRATIGSAYIYQRIGG